MIHISQPWHHHHTSSFPSHVTSHTSHTQALGGAVAGLAKAQKARSAGVVLLDAVPGADVATAVSQVRTFCFSMVLHADCLHGSYMSLPTWVSHAVKSCAGHVFSGSSMHGVHGCVHVILTWTHMLHKSQVVTPNFTAQHNSYRSVQAIVLTNRKLLVMRLLLTYLCLVPDCVLTFETDTWHDGSNAAETAVAVAVFVFCA